MAKEEDESEDEGHLQKKAWMEDEGEVVWPQSSRRPR